MRKAVLLLLVACHAREAPRGVAFGPAAKIVARPLVASDPGAVVRLIDPGREPRRVLRYHPTAAALQRLEVEMTSTATNMPLISEHMRQAADIRVEEVTADGVRVSEKVTASEMTSGAGQVVADRERRMMGRLIGRRVERVLDLRGRVRSVQGVAGDSFITSCVVPLPEEAVGVGARWAGKGAKMQQYLEVTTEAVYELVAADGDHLTLRVAKQTSAPAQRLDGEAVIAFESGAGEAELDVDLGRILPQRDDETMKVKMRMGAPGATMGLNMSARIKMRGL